MPSAAHEGALLLDKEQPDWWEKIDVDRLDMTSDENCVLGQLYRGYFDGLKLLGILYSHIEKGLGFTIPLELERSELIRKTRIALLTAAWKKQIADRQQAA